MSASTDDNLFWMLVIGASFLLAVGIAAMCSAAVATNVPLLHAWRVIVAMLAIVFIKRLADALPRVRVVSLRNL
jgi:uncharacterized membrane protein